MVIVLSLFLIFGIISQPGCSFKACSYKKNSVYAKLFCFVMNKP